jgi:cytidyltransferase-like protein
MTVIEVSGSFDDLRGHHVRGLEEAAQRGPVRVHLWSDDLVLAQTGSPPKFPLTERHYFVAALRYVSDVVDALPLGVEALAGQDVDARAWDGRLKLPFAVTANEEVTSNEKRVIVTGSFDWLHSGHVRFFEQVSELGRLYAVVGHDANIRLLKGEGHPLIGEAERLYMVASIRYVYRAMLSTGHGWLDAEPEIEHIRPDIYAVNEDGDKPEKRAYCEAHGIEYVVLARQPKDGLPRRSSTELRGF